MRKGRGKAAETHGNFSDFNFSASDTPCKKHPQSSHVGICPHCLKDKLLTLVCSECGKRRLSSCSCSDISSSRRNSCSIVDVGAVGSVSFLIDNDENDPPHSKSREKIRFWRIKKLFRKKTRPGELVGEFGDIRAAGVSRSRSLCSFGGGKSYDFDERSECSSSNAKISDVSTGFFFDSDKQFGFPNRSVFPIKESDFSAVDDESAFIDLKLDSGSIRGVSGHAHSYRNENFKVAESLASLKRNGLYGNGGSCRITMNEKALKQGSRNYRVWKWILKY